MSTHASSTDRHASEQKLRQRSGVPFFECDPGLAIRMAVDLQVEIDALESLLRQKDEEIARVQTLQDANYLKATQLGAENAQLRTSLEAKEKEIIRGKLFPPHLITHGGAVVSLEAFEEMKRFSEEAGIRKALEARENALYEACEAVTKVCGYVFPSDEEEKFAGTMRIAIVGLLSGEPKKE